MRLISPSILRRRNPVEFLQDEEYFLRPHSTAWALGDGSLRLVKEHWDHASEIDWDKFEAQTGISRAVVIAAVGDEPEDMARFVKAKSRWIAISTPFYSITVLPANTRAMEGLAFYLASAAIWFARKGQNLLDVDHSFLDVLYPEEGTMKIAVGEIISRSAAPGVERAMYNILEKMKTPKKPAHPETYEERRARLKALRR